jgi:hypothetical protein
MTASRLRQLEIVNQRLGTDDCKREAVRLDIRASDSIKVISIGSDRLNQNIFDVSIGGFSVLLPENIKFEPGNRYLVTIELPDKNHISVEAFAASQVLFKAGQIKCGFKFNFPILSDDFSDTYNLQDIAPVLGAIYKPHLFYERTIANIIAISENRYTIEVHDSDLILFPGEKFEFFISGPSIDFKPIIFEVLKVFSAENKRIHVFARPVSIPKSVRSWIGRFLVYHHDLTPSHIRSLGFPVKELSNGFKFRFIKTEKEYEEVLKLRFLAYKEAGKVSEGKTHVDMAAPLDCFSRIMGVYHFDKLIGSVAIGFPPSDKILLDIERGFPGGFPKKIPPKTQIVEISRLCTHPEYRRTDLLVRMFEYTYKTVHCGQRGYYLTSTDDKLWPLYRRLGFKKTGMNYPHPFLAGIKHHVILGKKTTPDSGLGINPLSWNYLWRDMGQYLENRGFVKRIFPTGIYIKFISLIGKLLRINLKKKY